MRSGRPKISRTHEGIIEESSLTGCKIEIRLIWRLYGSGPTPVAKNISLPKSLCALVTVNIKSNSSVEFKPKPTLFKMSNNGSSPSLSSLAVEKKKCKIQIVKNIDFPCISSPVSRQEENKCLALCTALGSSSLLLLERNSGIKSVKLWWGHITVSYTHLTLPTIYSV